MLTVDRVRSSRRVLRVVAVSTASFVAALTLAGQGTAASASAVTTRISVSSAGGQANGNSVSTSISPDGRYVAFGSDASNLVPGDTNRSQDVFIRDRQTGLTSRVSVTGSGAQAACCYSDADANPSVSPDGRFVVFTSAAPTLVTGDINDAVDVFVRDRLAGTTRRVNVSGAGGQAESGSVSGTSGSGTSEVSANGRFIAFFSNARNLVPGDTNGSWDVFLRDMQAGVTRRISYSGTGVQGNAESDQNAISADGRYVVFESFASNLVPGDTNSRIDVFLRDWQAGVTRRISYSGTGAPGNNDSADPAISADGRYVAFFSNSTNLVPGDTNGKIDVFLRDWRTGVTRRISYSDTGAQANGDSRQAAISPDGRYVAFQSDASNLVAGDTNTSADVFVRDWVAGTTRRASVTDTGVQGNGDSRAPAIGTGGRYVVFDSAATNLVPADTNGFIDIFLQMT